MDEALTSHIGFSQAFHGGIGYGLSWFLPLRHALGQETRFRVHALLLKLGFDE